MQDEFFKLFSYFAITAVALLLVGALIGGWGHFLTLWVIL